MTCPSLLNGLRYCSIRYGMPRERPDRNPTCERRVPIPCSACCGQRHRISGIKPVMEPETASDVEGRYARITELRFSYMLDTWAAQQGVTRFSKLHDSTY